MNTQALHSAPQGCAVNPDYFGRLRFTALGQGHGLIDFMALQAPVHERYPAMGSPSTF